MGVTSILLSEAVSEYLAIRGVRCAVSTVKSERQALENFQHHLGRDLQMRHLTARHVEGFFVALRSEHKDRRGRRMPPVTPGGWTHYRSRLLGFTGWCQRRGYLRADVMAEVPPMKAERRPRLQLPPEALLRLLDAATDERDRAFLALCVNTGLRAGEVSRLRVGDLDLEQGWLHVVISKTRESDRMPVSTDLATEMAAWLRHYAVTIGRPLRADDVLVPARKGTVYAGPGRRTEPGYKPDVTIKRAAFIAKEALARLGYADHREGVHTIRRSIGRVMYDRATAEGHDGAIRLASAMLHHSSAATTERYLQLAPERLKRDQMLRGQGFLRALVQSDAEVVPLRQQQHLRH